MSLAIPARNQTSGIKFTRDQEWNDYLVHYVCVYFPFFLHYSNFKIFRKVFDNFFANEYLLYIAYRLEKLILIILFVFCNVDKFFI